MPPSKVTYRTVPCPLCKSSAQQEMVSVYIEEAGYLPPQPNGILECSKDGCPNHHETLIDDC